MVSAQPLRMPALPPTHGAGTETLRRPTAIRASKRPLLALSVRVAGLCLGRHMHRRSPLGAPARCRSGIDGQHARHLLSASPPVGVKLHIAVPTGLEQCEPCRSVVRPWSSVSSPRVDPRVKSLDDVLPDARENRSLCICGNFRETSGIGKRSFERRRHA